LPFTFWNSLKQDAKHSSKNTQSPFHPFSYKAMPNVLGKPFDSSANMLKLGDWQKPTI